MKRLKKILFLALMVAALSCLFCQPAFAISEEEVQAQVDAVGKEAVSGNVLIWFMCAIGFLKVSQKIDSFMASLGVNVGHTGGSMLAEAMIAARGFSGFKSFASNHFAGGRSSHSSHVRANGGGKGGAGFGAGFASGGLAGVIKRNVTNNAVKTATTPPDAKPSGLSGLVGGAAGGIGGHIYASSVSKGGNFANNVIGSVATGSITQMGTMTGDILTIRSREEVETQEDREDVIWHEIHNAYRTRRILTGQLGGIEQLDNRKTVAVVDYKGFRIIIPIKEMMINLGRSPSGQEYADLMLRQNKILGNMLGADIDFVVRGIDSKTRSVVASRREAMMRKRQTFYFDLDAEGKYRIYEGRIVQARVIAVAEKVIRVEVFGVETSILARDLAWDWIGDAHERFSVGDEVLVRILNVRRNSLEDLGIRADIKSTSENTDRDNLQKCRIQGKYAGKVTDVHKGVVYVRLANGVNAVAHSCYDYRMPGKKDDVSFAVTHLDVERGIALGIITRIIRQNL